MTSIEERLDTQIADIASSAGALNLANAKLVATMADVLADDAWSGPGMRSAAQWLSYKAGVDISRANTIIAVAERRADFPNVIGRFDAGELSLEQVAELLKAPAGPTPTSNTGARSQHRPASANRSRRSSAATAPNPIKTMQSTPTNRSPNATGS